MCWVEQAYTAELTEELQNSQLKLKQLLQWKRVAFEHVDLLRAENDELTTTLASAGRTLSQLRAYRRLFKALAARSFVRVFRVRFARFASAAFAASLDVAVIDRGVRVVVVDG
jgi:hypothetical protein